MGDWAVRAGFTQIQHLVLVLDKGNDSQENFTAPATPTNGSPAEATPDSNYGTYSS